MFTGSLGEMITPLLVGKGLTQEPVQNIQGRMIARVLDRVVDLRGSVQCDHGRIITRLVGRVINTRGLQGRMINQDSVVNLR